MNIMRMISAADLIWIATATLSRENPERKGFSHDEIRRKANELEPQHGFKDVTIRTHISTHCVANKKPDPLKHRKLYLNDDGSYRLFREGDNCEAGRLNGKVEPDSNTVPERYRPLIAWYKQELRPATSPERDPLLALRGLGKEIWRELGGGEKFIRELRANWYGIEAKKSPARRSSRRKAG